MASKSTGRICVVAGCSNRPSDIVSVHVFPKISDREQHGYIVYWWGNSEFQRKNVSGLMWSISLSEEESGRSQPCFPFFTWTQTQAVAKREKNRVCRLKWYLHTWKYLGLYSFTCPMRILGKTVFYWYHDDILSSFTVCPLSNVYITIMVITDWGFSQHD